jgi:hypothetical protein
MSMPVSMLHVYAVGHVQGACPCCMALKWKKIKSKMKQKIKAKEAKYLLSGFNIEQKLEAK